MALKEYPYYNDPNSPSRFSADTPQSIDSARIEALFDVTLPQNEIIALTPQPVLSFLLHDIRRYWENAPNENAREMIKRKIIHTRKVMAVAAQIAMATPEVAWNLAEVLSTAALHDIARFPQAFYFETFRDADSFDHALIGADRIRQGDLPFAEYGIDGQTLIESIEQHSSHSIPDDASALSRLLRDADKFVILTEDIRDFDNYGRETERFAINSDAHEQFKRREVVRNGNAPRSLMDKLIQRLSWIYDFNFAATRRFVANYDIFPRLLDHFATCIDPNIIGELDRSTEIMGEVLAWQAREVNL